MEAVPSSPGVSPTEQSPNRTFGGDVFQCILNCFAHEGKSCSLNILTHNTNKTSNQKMAYVILAKQNIQNRSLTLNLTLNGFN